MRSRNVLVAGILLALLAVVAWAADSGRTQAVDQTARSAGYKVSTRVGEYRSNADGADVVLLTDATGGIAAIATFQCAGFPSVSVAGKFSAASATCVIHVYRCTYDATNGLVVRSKSKATLTAEATLTDGSTAADYMGVNSAGFDTEACPIVKVVIEDPSSGNIDLIVEAY